MPELAELIFSPNLAEYLPVVFTRWEGVECYSYSPLIYANGCEHIALTGNGRIVGNGEAWWHWKQLQHDTVKRLDNTMTIILLTLSLFQIMSRR